jgi:undecaprenyl-phosphate 4-deoxy-4-formamido-L-arabinose transferase
MTEAALSVVVPVYNSERTLQALAERLVGALEPLDREYEIVLVNDGSDDGSWDAIVALARKDSRIRGLDLVHNYGQHNALLAGARAARNPITVTLDDDLQNPPEEIPKLLEKLEEGHDLVYGKALEEQHGLARNLATRLTKLALRAAIGGDIAGKVSAYRAFRTPLRDAFAGFEGPDVSLDVLLSWGSRRVAAVPVAHSPRAEGRSTYTFGRLAKHALDVLTGFSTRPLRAASLIGLAFTLVGFGVLVLVLVRYFAEGSPVRGFPFLASIIAIFSGVQLLTLGVIGEYLARVHGRVMDRPPYTVREEVGGTD